MQVRPGDADPARPAAERADPARPAGLTVLAVDDEAPALDEVAYLLRGDPRVGTILTAGNAAQALALLTGSPGQGPEPDAVLLDIAMPGWDGVDLARVLSGLPRPPAVAFLSAHDNRAVEAYEIGAVDYLLKPVRAARLAEAVTRFCAARDAAMELDRRRAGHPAEPARAAAPAAPSGRSGPADVMIAVDLAGSTRFVPRSSVCWAEAQGDYARLHTATASHLVRVSLNALEERWGEHGFVRIHRSTLVSTTHITAVTVQGGRCRVRLDGDTELEVSRRHTRALRDRLIRATR